MKLKILALFFILAIGLINPVASISQILWSSAPGSAWLTGSNWTGGAVPNTTDIAQFGANPTGAGGVGINMNGSTNNGANNQAIGAIEITNARVAAHLVGNSSTSANGTLTFNGATVNSVNNVIIRNNSSQSFTVQNTQGSGNKTMGAALNNGTDNLVIIDGSGSVTFSNIISGGDGNPFSVGGSGSGSVILTGANTYTGLTTVSGSTLRLNRTGGTTIPTTNNVTLSGGTFRVSTNQTISDFTMSSGKLTVDAGIVLTITGSYNVTGGTISNSGTIKLNGGAVSFPGSGVTVDNGTANTMTNLEIASSANITINSPFTISGTLTMTSSKVLLGSNDLTLGASATIANATNAKFIVTDGSGSLIRNSVGTTAKAFPVGGAVSTYTPVTITNNGTSDNFSVNVSSSTAPSCVTTAPLDPQAAVNGTWNIAEAVAGGSNCTLVIDYGTLTTGGTFNASAAKIAHCNGSVVDYYSGSVAGTVVTGTGFVSFSPYGISSDQSLPIELRTFTNLVRNSKIDLYWNTATESNNDYFSIERSSDGRSFSEIGQVKGAGTSYEPKEYSFTDEHPLYGKNYYRLRQVDFDGQYSYSPVVTATFGKASLMTLAPLPATESIQFRLEQAAATDGVYQVYDLNGRLQLSGPIQAETREQALNISHLPEGAYVLRLLIGADAMVEQFRKIN